MMKTDVPAAVCHWRGLQICSGCGTETGDDVGKKKERGWGGKRKSEIEQEDDSGRESGCWLRKNKTNRLLTSPSSSF